MTAFRSILAAMLAWAVPAGAVQTPQYDVPYLGAAPSLFSPDSVRESDAVGGGYQIVGGWPLSGNTAIEVRLIDHEMRRQLDQSANFQTSVFADYVYDFGTGVKGEGGFFSGTKFFVLAGLGAIQEDSYGEKGTYFGADAGGGLLVPLGFKGWAVRADARVQGQMNDEVCSRAAATAGQCADEASFLVDYTVAVALQVPLTIFFDRPRLAPAEDCPVEVVDPETGRRNCTTDSDNDGVPDGSDQCPASAGGLKVDATGCDALR